eukprot:COSAG05_NODE_1438_length_4885_cov_3.395529_5_plen_136_part_00
MPKKKKGKEMNNPTFEREDSSDEEGNDAFDSNDFNSRDELTPRRRKAKIDYSTKSLAEMRKKKEQQAVAAKRNEAGYAVKKGTKGRYKEQEIKERRQKNQQRARETEGDGLFSCCSKQDHAHKHLEQARREMEFQ